MVSIILMVVGGFLTIVGFVGLMALMFEPVHTMFMVIFRRKDDYVYYETRPGKALLQRNKKSLGGSCVFFMIVGILCFALGFFLRYGPRGLNSLFAPEVENGAQVGSSTVLGNKKAKINSDGNYVDSEGNEYFDYVIIRGSMITYRGEEPKTVEEFERFLEELRLQEGSREFFIDDDFAASVTYRQVEQLIKDKGMTYKGEYSAYENKEE
ncbi:MAG: hypothetical protein J6Z22_00810 [Lachnospiraceae bacterium]|nr:hypothetical protein [Lachnospiraceae bacterium]